MAADERWAQYPPLGVMPGFAERWFGGDYPTGRGQAPANLGWTCPVCGNGVSPRVSECEHGGHAQRMSGVTVLSPAMDSGEDYER